MKLIKWLIVNSLFLGVGIMALVREDTGLQNIFVFWCWVTAFIYTLICFNAAQKELVRKVGSSVPMWVDFLFDMAIVSLLLYRGDFLTVSVYFWGTLCLQNIHYKPPTLKELTEQ